MTCSCLSTQSVSSLTNKKFISSRSVSSLLAACSAHPCLCLSVFVLTTRRHQILIGSARTEAGQVWAKYKERQRASRQLLLLLLAACKYCQSSEERERERASQDLHVERRARYPGGGGFKGPMRTSWAKRRSQILQQARTRHTAGSTHSLSPLAKLIHKVVAPAAATMPHRCWSYCLCNPRAITSRQWAGKVKLQSSWKMEPRSLSLLDRAIITPTGWIFTLIKCEAEWLLLMTPSQWRWFCPIGT